MLMAGRIGDQLVEEGAEGSHSLGRYAERA